MFDGGPDMIPSHFAVCRGRPQHLPSLHHMKCVVWPAVDVAAATRKYFRQKHFFNLIYWLFFFSLPFLFVAGVGVGVLVGGRLSAFWTRPRVPSFPDTCSPGTTLTKQALALNQTSTCEPDPLHRGVVERWGGGD